LDGCAQALDTPQGHTVLIEFALASDDPAANLLARRALSQCRQNPQGADELTKQMRQAGRDALAQPARAANAALLLGEIRDPAAVPELVAIVQGHETMLRLAAIGQLRLLGDRRAVPALIPLLGDPRYVLRCSAHGALKMFAAAGDARAKAAIQGYTKTDCDVTHGM
jgi:hypothetical protein